MGYSPLMINAVAASQQNPPGRMAMTSGPWTGKAGSQRAPRLDVNRVQAVEPHILPCRILELAEHADSDTHKRARKYEGKNGVSRDCVETAHCKLHYLFHDLQHSVHTGRGRRGRFT